MAGKGLAEIIPQDSGYDYLNFLPFRINKKTGARELAVPGLLSGAVNSIYDAVTLPGDVYSGEREATPENTLNAAMSMMGVGSAIPRRVNEIKRPLQRPEIEKILQQYKASTPIPDDPRLQRYYEGSSAPPVMYHGTNQRKIAMQKSAVPDSGMRRPISEKERDALTIEQFIGARGDPDAPVAGFAAFEPSFAQAFDGGEGGSIYPLRVRATNLFDIANPAHRKLVKIKKDPKKVEGLKEDGWRFYNDYPWDWHDIEYNTSKIKKTGFDSYLDYEFDALKNQPTGIAVFNPGQFKSQFATKFDYTDPLLGNAKGGAITIDDGNPAKRRKLI